MVERQNKNLSVRHQCQLLAVEQNLGDLGHKVALFSSEGERDAESHAD